MCPRWAAERGTAITRVTGWVETEERVEMYHEWASESPVTSDLWQSFSFCPRLSWTAWRSPSGRSRSPYLLLNQPWNSRIILQEKWVRKTYITGTVWFCPDWLSFLQRLNFSHLDTKQEFPQLSAIIYPLSFTTRWCEQSPQAGVSTQNWKEEKLETGNDFG